ncbi:hypothetical protein KC19_12G161500 [Ceratodon purpureus]|uniref:TF-B3 domain-containing protein n=1 Tax=Ceratodon purpureus TaxID=3225 RepID=A0A8T0G8F1_CERPU|nr:hypothetical protein KC19_12G161500 [Ceratodon purpureus]
MADLYADAIAEMEDIGARFFSVYLESAHSMSVLDVPQEFTASTGWPGCADCGIITSSATMQESPVRFDRTGSVARSVGDGWARFLRDNNIRKGKFVVFEPVDERCLVAVVYPKSGTPEFTKKLRLSHTTKKNSAKLDIPSRFWRRYGSDNFDQRAFTLRGSKCSVTVKSVLKRTPRQTTCYFTEGWDKFRDQNDFGVGDTLVFTQVAHANFQVTKL